MISCRLDIEKVYDMRMIHFYFGLGKGGLWKKWIRWITWCISHPIFVMVN